MIYNASLDKLAKWMTVIISILFATIIIVECATGLVMGIIVAVILVGIYLFAYSYHPQYYEWTNTQLLIHRPLKNVQILKSDIDKMEALSKVEMNGTIRTFGVGGLFGYFGLFFNKTIGSATWYATKRKENGVLISLKNGKKILVTPDNVTGFVTA